MPGLYAGLCGYSARRRDGWFGRSMALSPFRSPQAVLVPPTSMPITYRSIRTYYTKTRAVNRISGCPEGILERIPGTDNKERGEPVFVSCYERSHGWRRPELAQAAKRLPYVMRYDRLNYDVCSSLHTLITFSFVCSISNFITSIISSISDKGMIVRIFPFQPYFLSLLDRE